MEFFSNVNEPVDQYVNLGHGPGGVGWVIWPKEHEKIFHKQLTPNMWVTKEKTYKKGENLGVDKTIQSSFQKKNSKWPF